jgi:hypothetical protein
MAGIVGLLACVFVKYALLLACAALSFSAAVTWLLTWIAKRYVGRAAAATIRSGKTVPLGQGIAAQLESCSISAVTFNLLTDFVLSGGKLAFVHIGVEGIDVMCSSTPSVATHAPCSARAEGGCYVFEPLWRECV